MASSEEKRKKRKKRSKAKKARRRRIKYLVATIATLFVASPMFWSFFDNDHEVEKVFVVPVKKLTPVDMGEFVYDGTDRVRWYWGDFELTESETVRAESNFPLSTEQLYCVADVKSVLNGGHRYYAVLEARKCDPKRRPGT